MTQLKAFYVSAQNELKEIFDGLVQDVANSKLHKRF